LALSCSGFHSELLRHGKTDLDWYIWFLRIHDYGFGWLHIYELVVDVLASVEAKILTIVWI